MVDLNAKPLRSQVRLGAALLACALAQGKAATAAEPELVDAASVVAGLDVDMRYAGSHNFTGEAVDGYDAPRCLLTRPAAEALAAVQQDLRRTGLGLKVFDCYRPARAVAAFVRWVHDPTRPGNKAEFFPSVDKGALIRLGYIAARSAHSSGSTVDLTLVSPSGEAPMGTGFDFFAPRAGARARGLSPQEMANRRRLQASMTARGFVPYAREWWHFTLRNEPYPGAAFDRTITP